MEKETFNRQAKEILNKVPQSDENDIARLAANLELVENKGLASLNKRLLDSNKPREIQATIVEHNFAAKLITHLPDSTIQYEPPPSKIDFKLEKDGIEFWIQMKDLSKLEIFNRQEKIFEKIKTAAKQVTANKYFHCSLSEGFQESSITPLVDFLKRMAGCATNEETYYFEGDNGQMAEIEFMPKSGNSSPELTLATSSNIQPINITSMDPDQMKKSFSKAAKNFIGDSSEKTVNLIVIEADNKSDTDIGNAVFGTEAEVLYSIRGYAGWTRENDGFFANPDYADKVAGIIALKKRPEKVELTPGDKADIANLPDDWKEMGQEDYERQVIEQGKKCIVSDYHATLYINEKFAYLIELLEKSLPLDQTIRYNMRPAWGAGDFKLNR